MKGLPKLSIPKYKKGGFPETGKLWIHGNTYEHELIGTSRPKADKKAILESLENK